MGLLSNRIEQKDLKKGDHIYSWRAKRSYAHHGIYVGDDKMIHFTRGGGQEVGTGTSFDLLLVSSSPISSTTPCSVCSSYEVRETNGVAASCLDCFLAGGALYRFEYAVSKAFFLAKVRGGTCTMAAADPDEVVVRRANHLLTNGFRSYNLFKNNCEDFAIYCKTGLIVAEHGSVGIGQSGQAVSALATGVSLITAMKTALVATAVTRFVGARVLGEESEVQVQKKEELEDKKDGQESGQRKGVSVIAATVICGIIAFPAVYCVARYKGDIGNRQAVLKIEVEDLTAGLASGLIRPASISQLSTSGQVHMLGA